MMDRDSQRRVGFAMLISGLWLLLICVGLLSRDLLGHSTGKLHPLVAGGLLFASVMGVSLGTYIGGDKLCSILAFWFRPKATHDHKGTADDHPKNHQGT